MRFKGFDGESAKEAGVKPGDVIECVVSATGHWQVGERAIVVEVLSYKLKVTRDNGHEDAVVKSSFRLCNKSKSLLFLCETPRA